MANIKPKNTAPVIPALVVLSKLLNIPINPASSYPARAAWYNALPNDVIGILLPTKEYSLIPSYNPKKDNTTPRNTNKDVI